MDRAPQSLAQGERQIFIETSNLVANKALVEFFERDCFQAVAIDDGCFGEHVEVVGTEFNDGGKRIGAAALTTMK